MIAETVPAPAPLPWRAPPLIEGLWVDLTPAAANEAMRLLARALERAQMPVFLEGASVQRLRAAPMPFYPRHVLVECQCELRSGPLTLFDFLLGPDGAVLLDGKVDSLHALNAHLGLALGEPALGLSYLKFFCSAVRAAEGRFEIISAPAQLHLAPAATVDERDAISSAVEPPSPGETVKDGLWYDATVRYGRGLYRSSFVLRPDGGVEMRDERPLHMDMPVLVESFEGPFRLPVEMQT